MRPLPKRSIALVACSIAILALHEVLVRGMAHGQVAHVLLGAGNGAPPLGAALLAVALVLVRLLAVVFVPGALAIAAVGLAAGGDCVPPRAPRVGPPERYLAGSYSIGTSDSDGAGTGTSMGAGGTV